MKNLDGLAFLPIAFSSLGSTGGSMPATPALCCICIFYFLLKLVFHLMLFLLHWPAYCILSSSGLGWAEL